MSNLKEQMKADLSIFFNTEELADTHKIDGKDIVCIIDEVQNEGLNTKNARFDSYDDGIYSSKIVIYVQSDLLKKPIYDQKMDIDGEYFKVKKAGEDAGMLEIYLEAYDS